MWKERRRNFEQRIVANNARIILHQKENWYPYTHATIVLIETLILRSVALNISQDINSKCRTRAEEKCPLEETKMLINVETMHKLISVWYLMPTNCRVEGDERTEKMVFEATLKTNSLMDWKRRRQTFCAMAFWCSRPPQPDRVTQS